MRPRPDGGASGSPSGLPGPRQASWRVVAFVAIAGLAAAMGAAYVTTSLVDGSTRAGAGLTVAFSPNRSVLPRIADAPSVLAKVLPSVVGIRTALAPGSTPNCADEGDAGGVGVDEGTGIVVSAGGEILTNNHVVAGGTGITVTLDGRGGSYTATLVGADPAEDLALLQLEGAPKLPPIAPAAPASAQVGDGVLAVGDALGLSLSSPTVTEGIVSAEGRVVTAGVSCTDETLDDLLQTDAAINPGNSGGPLVDGAGQVIAIATAVASGARGQATAQDVGFAIPIWDAMALLPGLRLGGTIGTPKAFLGVQVESMTALLRQEFDYTPGYGALVDSVIPGSPASVAGLRPGDVIVALGDRRISSAVVLRAVVSRSKPGDAVAVRLYRGKVLHTIAVLLSAAPSPA